MACPGCGDLRSPALPAYVAAALSLHLGAPGARVFGVGFKPRKKFDSVTHIKGGLERYRLSKYRG